MFDRLPKWAKVARRGLGRSAVDGAPAGRNKAHLVDFARTHAGVEAYVEPPTAMSPTTVVFVASDGEWTRREVPDARTVHELANTLGIPSYDAAVVGYPQRMREWNSRKTREAKEREAAERERRTSEG